MYGLFFLFCINYLHAQDKKDTLQPKKPFAPQSIRIFTNIYLPAQLIFSDRFKSWEASIEWWQKKGYAFVGEVGYAQRTRNNGYYRTEGAYVRLGMEIGFWERQPNRRANGAWQMGGRLGFSSFDYTHQGTIANAYWGTAPFEDRRQGLWAFWAEWHLSLRAKIGKRFMMGPMVKLKTLLYSPSTTLTGKPPEVVGFGVRRGLQGEAGYWIGFILEK